MIELIWDEKFIKILKKWKKKHPKQTNNFEKRLNLFINEPFHNSLKTHRLSGNLKEYWTLSINYEQRLIFKFISDDKALLIDIGTHDEVY
ncbi:MAG: type II toxin-antitoxin system mRNA interferase toxin, RelE/StbE family [Bacteroidales bacterium]|nr:type II toxin-antitoxin system mRNA interferase toxin, RelE/StbE family [Bacteroidales bacterium]